jgi:cytochrome c oxidase subunit 1
MIAVPSAIKIFNWLGTTWRSDMYLSTAMLHSLGFVSMFVIGGLSGIFMAATPVDVYFHDTYFIVAHIHYVLFMSSLLGIFAAIHFWYPKMFGRTMSEFWGKIHFALTFVFANCAFYPMHILGVHFHMRRISDPLQYPQLQTLQPLNQFITISAFLMGAAQLIFLANFLISLVFGARVGRNPWRSNTLEWSAPSPPPHGNFAVTPNVYRGPYEYSVPGHKEDYWPQDAEPQKDTASGHPSPAGVPTHA